MQIGIVKETVDNESRVAASPSSITQLLKLNFSVVVESDAGVAASFSDAEFTFFSVISDKATISA